MYLVVMAIGVLAGAVSGVIGTGSSIILIPALAWAFGPKAAIPIMAVAAIMGNLARVLLWRNAINLRALVYYSVPGIPAAMLGANMLWAMPVTLSNLCIGLFFLLMIPLRHWAKARSMTLSAWQLALAGAIVGFLTGVVFSTGPMTIPVFAGFGLTKGALLATEAAASVAIYLAKAATFGAIGALPQSIVLSGVLVGCTLVAGTWLGKRFVLRISETLFTRLIDTMLLLAGLSMLWEVVR